jgi:hypothetical protein
MDSGAVEGSSSPFSEAALLGLPANTWHVVRVSSQCARGGPPCKKSHHPDYFRDNLDPAAIQTTF